MCCEVVAGFSGINMAWPKEETKEDKHKEILEER